MNATTAYSAFQVKSVDNDRRIFRGWATTPTTDRMNDTIDPLGARFTNPLTLLHQHDRNSPIGSVTFSKPTVKGIEFVAEIPKVQEPGIFKDRTDLAWSEIVYGAVRAVSIGFRAIKFAHKDDGGIDFSEIEIYELSTVSIPALPDAVITAFKSADSAQIRSALQIARNCGRGYAIPEVAIPSRRNADGSIKIDTAVRQR